MAREPKGARERGPRSTVWPGVSQEVTCAVRTYTSLALSLRRSEPSPQYCPDECAGVWMSSSSAPTHAMPILMMRRNFNSSRTTTTGEARKKPALKIDEDKKQALRNFRNNNILVPTKNRASLTRVICATFHFIPWAIQWHNRQPPTTTKNELSVVKPVSVKEPFSASSPSGHIILPGGMIGGGGGEAKKAREDTDHY